MHHVLADGATALDMFTRLCSNEADPPPPPPLDGVGTVSTRKIVLNGLVRFARRPWYLATKVIPTTVVGVLKARRSARSHAMSGVFTAPRTPLNANVSERRSVAYVQLDLADVKTVKDKFGVTVNDVILALVSAVLRGLLLDRAALPGSALVVMVAVSVFDAERTGRNQLALMLSSLCTDVADPVDRLKAIADASSAAKSDVSTIGPSHLQDLMECLPGFLALSMRLYRWSGRTHRQPVYNLTVSNVRGPQEQCYLMGAAVKARYAFGPVFHGAGLDIIAMSLDGNLDVGFTACSDVLPNLWGLADALPVALKELLEAAQ
jgi:diacylglycerol O-acyltransferase / wax synthase